jgi:hypothetical protein
MDRAAHAVLAAEMGECWVDIGTICDRIDRRRGGLGASEEHVEAMAYQLHNLYSACERLFETVAHHFENHVTGTRYHTDLPRRMKIAVEGVRPALISTEAFALLDEFRRFRHLFRHAYGSGLDAGKVSELAEKALALRSRLESDSAFFLAQLIPRPPASTAN